MDTTEPQSKDENLNILDLISKVHEKMAQVQTSAPVNPMQTILSKLNVQTLTKCK